MASSSFNAGDKVGIIGTGLVGRSWVMVFSAYGFRVSLYDVIPSKVQEALDDIKKQLENLHEVGQLRGKLTVDEQLQLISAASSLEDCIESAIYVQESVPENLEMRKNVYKELDRIVKPGTILASSTSFMPSSTYAGDMTHRSQVLVAHPVHPTYYMRLVEVVPSPDTDPTITERALAFLKFIEQTPILQKKEITCFAVNYINSALVAACWRLVEEDIVSPEDVDKMISDGLAMRMSLLGVFQSSHYAANGFADMIEKYGSFVNHQQEVSRAEKHKIDHESDTCRRIAEAMSAKVPLDKLDESRREYVKQLICLAKFKSELQQ